MPIKLVYEPPGKVLRAFLKSDAFVRGVRGPIGSGKSTACVIEIMRRAGQQKSGPDGVRRSRWAVVRNCYDDRTEILTEARGWQFFKDLRDDDCVATLVDGRLGYQLPERVYAAPYQGEMIGFEGEAVDFLVTPDHKMHVSKRRTRGQVWGAFEDKTAAEIYGSANAYRVRKDAEWLGAPIRFDEHQFEWLGYWFAEGSIGTYGGRRRCTVTSVNDVDYARDLFKRAGIVHVEWRRDRGVNFVVSGDHPILALLGGRAAIKAVPQEVKEAPAGHIGAFLRGFAVGDGHKRKEGTQTLYTSSRQLADDLQELALKAGGAATVSVRDRRGMAVRIGNASGVVNHVEYTVTQLTNGRLRPILQRSVHKTRHRGWYKQPYDGMVYCVEMPLVPVYVRRRGKSFWCYRTYPELKTTTIKTWHQWIPQSLGQWTAQGPPTHRIAYADFDCEVLFIALDTPDDISKLLSLELTGAWINEAREVPKAIVDGLTGRVGRFPPVRDGGCTWAGIIMDTNSPDTDHWWYRLAEGEQPTDWKFFAQPPGNSEQAENTKNLPANYYDRAAAGKDHDWITVYLRGQYGFVRDGKPVYPDFTDAVHGASEPIAAIASLPLYVGVDFGLTPAAAFGQRLADGRWQWIDELVTEDMGARRFGELLGAKLRGEYAQCAHVEIFGDPSGDIRAQTDETTPFQIMNEAGKLSATPAPSNDPVLRIEAVSRSLGRLIDGKPGLLVSPKCRVLRKAMNGAYCYRRMEVTGQERFRDVPEKNKYSHVADAAQYMMLGAGEGSSLISGAPRAAREPEYAGDTAWMG